jgi:hypothetical protein
MKMVVIPIPQTNGIGNSFLDLVLPKDFGSDSR